MTFPESRRVVLGLQPSRGRHAVFGDVESSSSKRLDSLFHDWRDQAVGANIYWSEWDQVSHIDEILSETKCEIVVSLGIFASELLGVTKPKLLEMYDVRHHYPRELHVLVFPHPSGRNRFWNDPDNRVRASMAFRKAMLA